MQTNHVATESSFAVAWRQERERGRDRREGLGRGTRKLLRVIDTFITLIVL